MVSVQRNIFGYEKIIAFCFFLSISISVWAVRTPHSELGSDMLRAFLAGLFYILLIAEYAISLFLYRSGRIKRILFLTALWPVLYWIYIHIWSFEIESLAITSPIIVFIFAIQNDTIKRIVFVLFKKLLIITSLIGIICYLSYVFGLGIPYTIAPYYDGRPYQNYVNYFNISFLYINSSSIRVCGIFNEPGWLGTTIGLLLCYEKFEMRKVSNWILLVAGLMTYSLAFVILFVVGFIIRNIAEIKKWIAIAICLGGILVVLPNINTDNPQLNKLIARLEFTSSGLKGNNRSSSTVDELLSETMSSKRFMFGYGDGYAEYYNGLKEYKQVLTIKTELINLGLVGTMLLYIVPFFFFWKLSHKNKKAMVFVICFWISLYQRPWLYIVSNYMLLLSIIPYIQATAKENHCLGRNRIISVRKKLIYGN